MDLFLTWAVAPAAVLLVLVGLSLLVESLAELELPWAARPALGLATVFVIAPFGVILNATAELTAPAIVVLGAVGLWLGFHSGRLSAPLPGPELLAALGVFLVSGASVFLSGEPTWAGYIKLDDTATWMGLTDHAFGMGQKVEGLQPSTYEALISINAGNGYPIGSFVPMKLLSLVSGQDLAWVVQPSMALMAAILALAIAELLRPAMPRAWMRAAIAFIAAQAGLFLGFALWGGIKEIALGTLLPIGPLLAWAAINGNARRAWIPLGIVVAAFVASLSPGGVVWVLPVLVLLLPYAKGKIGMDGTLRLVGMTALLAAALSLPGIIGPNGLFKSSQYGIFAEEELGNLFGDVSPFQLAGIWPSTDFRTDPHIEGVVKLIAIAVIVLAGFAAFALRRRAPAFTAYVAGSVAAGALIWIIASPWVDAKALAVVCPAVLGAGLAGAWLAATSVGRPYAAWLAGSVVAGLVLWSSFLAYQGAWLAPRDRNLELEQIGAEFDGQGPTLDAESSVIGPRHFLRELDTEGEFDLRRRPVLLTDGREPEEGGTGDPDEIRLDQLSPYRTLITQRSPTISRPPPEFVLLQRGRYYDVWQRRLVPAPGRSRIAHLPLGTEFDASSVPNCAAVRDLAEQAGPDGLLIAARALPPPIIVDFSAASMPSSWSFSSPLGFFPGGDGTLTTSIPVAQTGGYEAFLGGSVFGSLDVDVAGNRVSTARDLSAGPAPRSIGTMFLNAGQLPLEIRYEGAGLEPGSAATYGGLVPLLFAVRADQDLGVVSVPADRPDDLCGVRWDWIEAYS